MQRSNTFALRRGLLILLLMVSAGFLVISALSVLGNYHGSRSLQSLHDDQVVPLHQIKMLVESYGMRVQNAILRLDAGESTVEEGIDQIRAAQDSISANWNAYQLVGQDTVIHRLVESLNQSMMYADMEIANTLRYLEIQQSLGNRLLANQLYPLVGALNPSVRPVLLYLDSLGSIHLHQAEQEYRDADRRAGWYLFVSLMVAAFGTLLGPWSVLRAVRRINNQLRAILPVLQRLERGELEGRVQAAMDDELGLIAAGINRMAQSLQQMVRQMEQDSIMLMQTSRELTTIAQHAYADAKTHVEQTKKTAAVAQEMALRLENGLDLLNMPTPPPDSGQRLRNILSTLRNENMLSVVRSLSSTRATAVQSAREIDLLQHKAQMLSSMANRLTQRMITEQKELPGTSSLQ